MSNPILENLTPAQLAAVMHIEGPLLILAGPGSGKTRVVTHRVANLLQHEIPARNILALTFTNKAADEMRLRLQRLAPRQPVWMGTFHRFCAQLLRQHADLVGLRENYSIFDMDDAGKALAQAIEDANVDLSHTTPAAIASSISWAKNNLVSPEEFQPKRGSVAAELAAKIYPLYQKRLLAANAVDFDDLLMHVAILLRDNPELRRKLDERFRFILVDEYQDTNMAQYAIVRALSNVHPNLAVTGDPDQSIYGWRGANLNNILEFEHDFPNVRVVRLEQNYRSTKNILHVADVLISHNKQRKQKALFTQNDVGVPVRLITFPSHRDEAEQIAGRIAADVHSGRRRPRDFAIFYRTNALSRQLEHSLAEQGLPYQIVHGVEFYQRKEIKDVLAYLHLLNNPRNDIAFARVINTPARGIGRTTLNRLRQHADRYGQSQLEAARESGLIEALGARAAVAVAKFVSLFDRLTVHAVGPVENAIRAVLDETGYRTVLESSDNEEDAERLANIEELLTAAHEFDEQNGDDAPLEKFLEQAALVNDVDDLESATDKVTMMTLHAAKGLEFPVVFVVAIEQGVLPHKRSETPDKIEEERRLLFVGITRAEEELQLSHACRRSFRGESMPAIPSPFLMELPREGMEIVEPASRSRFREKWSDGLDNVADEVWTDDEFVQDMPRTPPPAPKPIPQIRTAAEMLTAASPGAGGSSTSVASAKTNVTAFRTGMIVKHPEYGPGIIVTISGADAKQVATVRFTATVGEKKFRLAHSNLQAVK